LTRNVPQPLHCVALFSDKCPDGDRGGNSIRIRISSSPTNLHSLWDGLLGRGLTAGNIGKDVAQIQAVLKEKNETIQPDLDAHKTPVSWAKEGAALAPHAVYVDGDLLKPRAGSTDDVLQAPPEYAPAAGRIARVQIGKAGKRLADTIGELCK
jgi:S1/P1 Nuclease